MKESNSLVERIDWKVWKEYLLEFSGGMPTVALSSRLFINIEQIILLEKNNPFSSDIKLIRNKLHIPELISRIDQGDTDHSYDSSS